MENDKKIYQHFCGTMFGFKIYAEIKYSIEEEKIKFISQIDKYLKAVDDAYREKQSKYSFSITHVE